jgi:hypothetical protein
MGPESTLRRGGCGATRCPGVVLVVAVIAPGEGYVLTRLGGDVVPIEVILICLWSVSS